MDFPFDIHRLLPERITLLDQTLRSRASRGAAGSMDFPFDIHRLLPERITLLDQTLRSRASRGAAGRYRPLRHPAP
ncbi:hypothetical protein NDU88_013287 [Pleurodeles waltl]|uniref:Uncharacterized protein n=1 Tax=Pleurodeles waltl TaxID=8319 RepID=A0AAV7R2M7_PLEWA|nr:hypothetical protein NDU88_013287 [Pleurodeles waltl]